MLLNPKVILLIILLSKIKSSLKVLVLTQNQGGLIKKLKKNEKIKKNFENFKEKLFLKISEKDPDVIIYGIQELIELKPLALFFKDKKNGIQNFAGLAKSDLNTEKECKIFKNILKQIFPLYKIKYNANLSMVTFVLVKKSLEFKLKILKAVNENGLFTKNNFNHGYWGQKGGIISLIEIFSQNKQIYYKLISINAHLDSKSSKKRFLQYKNLLLETKKIIDKKIKNYTIFFSGDMNSRLTENEEILLKNENFYYLVGKYKNLFEKNQKKKYDLGIYEYFEEFSNYLNLKKIYKMKEKFINFPPTYKLNFKNGKNCEMENNYENCYKKKDKLIFSYTDRIFYFTTPNQEISLNNDKENYNILYTELISDHHPVFGFFEISIIKEELTDFKISSYNIGKVDIKNERAIEKVRKLLLFLDPEKNEVTNNKLMEILDKSDDFFINTINLYEYLKEGEINCEELVGDKNKIVFFNEIKLKFLKCYDIINNKKFEAILKLEEIKNDEDEQDLTFKNEFITKNDINNKIKEKNDLEIDKKDDIVKNKGILKLTEIKNYEEEQDLTFENEIIIKNNINNKIKKKNDLQNDKKDDFIKNKGILKLTEIKNYEDKENLNLSDQYYIKNNKNIGNKKKYTFQIDKKDEILENRDIEDILENENIDEINDMINFVEVEKNDFYKDINLLENIIIKKPIINNIFENKVKDGIFKKNKKNFKNEKNNFKKIKKKKKILFMIIRNLQNLMMKFIMILIKKVKGMLLVKEIIKEFMKIIL